MEKELKDWPGTPEQSVTGDPLAKKPATGSAESKQGQNNKDATTA